MSAGTDMRPVLFITNLVAPDRRGAFAALHAAEGIELALFGGRSHHATGPVADPGVPHRRVEERAVARLAASGRYRAVICGTAGRLALPGAAAGARAARGGRAPFLLWSALWAQPVSPAHLLSWPLLRALYAGGADAIVTYGPHVSAFVGRRGARRVFVAPQAVDNAFWSRRRGDPAPPGSAAFTALFVGRPAHAKGAWLLERAWRASGLPQRSPAAALGLLGDTSAPPPPGPGGALPPGEHRLGHCTPEQVRNFLGHADVLVMPSVPTRTFREPWGLVANEAMNQHVPVIASDAVGAAAGGLVRDGRNGLVVTAGDEPALAGALVRLHDDAALRHRLGENASRDVAAYTYDAWASGFSAALAAVGRSRTG
jgi:glycosyltransferase involved in cell wall biosynthesis